MTSKKFPLNYRKDNTDNRDYLFKNAPNYKLLEAARPTKIDWSNNMSPVKDQGVLGSCVAFSLAAMKEWQEIIERKAAAKEYGPSIKQLEDLSESYIYWNAKKIDPWPNEEGTSIRYGMQVLQKYGVPTEDFWPYVDKSGTQPKAGADQMAAWMKIGSYWRLQTLEEILTALSKQPIPIGIMCYEEIFNVGSDGIVPLPKDPSKPMGGHAICLVGYDDEKRLIKFKNSWGTSWGDNGYGYLPYDYFSHVLDAWTCLDMQITEGELPVPSEPPKDKKDSFSNKWWLIGSGILIVILLFSIYMVFGR